MRGCLAALLLCLSAAAAAAPQVSIELLPQATVTGDSVLLGQVAHLRSTDLALMRKLVDLPLGRAPRPGQQATVQRSTLATWVRQQAGVADEVLAWRGAETSRVTRQVRRVAGADIASAATEALRARLAAQGVAADVQLASMPRDLELPSEEPRLQARPLEHAHLRRRMLVWVDVWAGAALVRTVPVTLEVAAPDAPLQLASDVLSPATAAKAQPEATHQAPVVLRGEWASLRSVAGAVALDSHVEVLQDGGIGQKVRVRQQGATGIVFGRVMGRGLLELAP